MMYETIAVFAVVVFLYSVLAGGLERTIVGGAITFTSIGIVLGPLGVGLLDLSLDAEALRGLAELTLALVLFIDAADADLGEVLRSRNIPRRLLLLGLPLIILLGTLAGLALFDNLTLVEIALLATILAATDAALGKAVITDETVPNRIRTSLNFESGLNDGICVPIFLAFLAFATETAGGRGFTEIALHLIVEEIGIGAAIGIAFSAVAAKAIVACHESGWITPTWRPALVPALALTCFTAAQALGGSGFIASFVGGLLFGALTRAHKHEMLQAAESCGDVVTLLTWVVFGATVVSGIVEKASWQMLIYALLSLTVVRMLSVWLVLRGTGLSNEEALFVGWFGPRGLASIVFAIMAINAKVPGADFIAVTVGCTVLLSIIGHGLTAKPLSKVLSLRLGNAANVSSPETRQ